MDEDQKEETTPEPIQDRAQELGVKFERFIIGAVANKFGLAPNDLQLLNDSSAEFSDDPGIVYFRVLDRNANNMYGVIATIQPDGGLADYRCDLIAL
jgi:hypothetical protein